MKKELVKYTIAVGIGAVCSVTAFPLVLDRLGYKRHKKSKAQLTVDIPEDEVEPDGDFME